MAPPAFFFFMEVIMAVADRIKEIIINELDVSAESVTDEASFIDDLGADSLDTVELIMAFEEEFDLEIPDDDAEKIGTVQDAIKYVETHSNSGKE